MISLRESLLDNEDEIVDKAGDVARLSTLFDNLRKYLDKGNVKKAAESLKMLGLDMTSADKRTILAQCKKANSNITDITAELYRDMSHINMSLIYKVKELTDNPIFKNGNNVPHVVHMLTFGVKYTGEHNDKTLRFLYYNDPNDTDADSIQNIVNKSDYVRRVESKLLKLGFKRETKDSSSGNLITYSYKL